MTLIKERKNFIPTFYLSKKYLNQKNTFVFKKQIIKKAYETTTLRFFLFIFKLCDTKFKYLYIDLYQTFKCL